METKIIEALKQYDMKEAYILIYFIDKVVLGKYKDEKLFIPVSYDESLCTSIHIFNKDKELRTNSLDNEFKQVPELEEYLEECIYVIGSEYESYENYTIARQYGREIVLPFVVYDTKKNSIRIQVRNYYGEDASFSGYRLVNIIGGDING